MKEEKNFKIKIGGVVKSNFKDADTGKRTINLYITPSTANLLEDKITEMGMEWYADRYPIKEETDTGNLYVATRSLYNIPVKNLPKGYTIEDIGRMSKVIIYCNIKEGESRRKGYVSAYILGIEVNELVEKELYDVFSEDSFEDAATAADIFPDIEDKEDKKDKEAKDSEANADSTAD